MHLIKIVYGNDKGGIFTCESQYLEIFRRKGVHVHLIIVGNGVNKPKYESMVSDFSNIEDIEIKFNGGIINRIYILIRTFLFGFKYARKLKRKFSNIPVQGIIYRREAFMFLGGFLSISLKSKCYWHIANTVNNRSSQLLYTGVCRLFNIIPVANSIYTKSTLGTICKHVIYPGFGETRLRENFEDDKFGLPIAENEPVYGMIARVCTDKAQDLLVEGFAQSDAIKNGGHLVLAGNVSDQSFLELMKAKAGEYWGKKIHYIGQTNEAAKFYSVIDVAINARRNAEPFGISIAEGLYMSKPVISYYLGGPAEMITDDINGWLVRHPTPHAYAKAINRSLFKRNKWSEMGYNSHIISSKFSAETNVIKFIDLIVT